MQPYVIRTIRIRTQQVIIKDIPEVYGLPTRRWKMEILMLDDKGEEKPASIFQSVTYHLHPTFVHPTRELQKPPFTLDEQGWGEFDLKIVGKLINSKTTYTFHHDLSFSENAYNSDFECKFPYHTEELRGELKETGLVPEYKETAKGLVDIKKLQKAINLISIADIETVQNVVNLIVSFPPVTDELKKRFHRDDDFVILLSQLPDQLIDKICKLVSSAQN